MRAARWGLVGVLCCAGLLLGCGDDDDGGGNGSDASPGGGTSVGPEGGVVSSDDGNVVLFVPAGAIASGSIEVTIVESGTGFPDQSALLAPVYELGPEGVDFDVPVTVSIAFDAAFADDTPAAIVTLDPDTDTWLELPASTVTGGRAFAQTTHFSHFSAATPADTSQLCLFRGSPAPLVVPGNVVVSNATQVRTSTAFSGADQMELGSRWEASAANVTISGLAGPPAGSGAFTVFGTMGEGVDAFAIAEDGTFSIEIDLAARRPWFGLTDACLAPHASGAVGWLYNLEIACDAECLKNSGSGPGTNVPECSAFPTTVTMQIPEGFTTFRSATLGYKPDTTCAVVAPPDTTTDGILNFRRSTSTGARTVTIIAGVNRWDIHDISHGTRLDNTQAHELPDGVDIDMGIMPTGDAVPTHRVWFRFDGDDVTIIALAEE